MPKTAKRTSAGIGFAKRRWDMVEHQIVARGVRSALVLEAMRKVPREEFLPWHLRELAYEDTPLPIAAEQTISQPYIVALMADALLLKGGERVLEIGTGSGYAAAILAEIAGEVYSVERIGQLAEKAAATLAALGYDNVHVQHGDGSQGCPEHAPYDAIIVTAGGPRIPKSLQLQLKVGGRLVIPVGTEVRAQELIRVTRVSMTEFRREDLADVRFVPLLGKEGWEPEAEPSSQPRLRVVRPTEQVLSRIFNIVELPMSRLTVFLARFIGLFTVLLVVGLLVRGSATVETAAADGSVMLVYAIISLAVGLAMILGHNVWSGGALPVIVTLVGWLILAKGLMLLFITPDALKGLFGHMRYGQHYYLYLMPAFVIGLYLTWAGFTVASPNTRL